MLLAISVLENSKNKILKYYHCSKNIYSVCFIDFNALYSYILILYTYLCVCMCVCIHFQNVRMALNVCMHVHLCVVITLQV